MKSPSPASSGPNMAAKAKATTTIRRTDPIPEPSPTYAVPERPRSSDPQRVAIRIEGITYSIPADQADAFKARYKTK